jgi:hypothetical protein
VQALQVPHSGSTSLDSPDASFARLRSVISLHTLPTFNLPKPLQDYLQKLGTTKENFRL